MAEKRGCRIRQGCRLDAGSGWSHRGVYYRRSGALRVVRRWQNQARDLPARNNASAHAARQA